MLKWIEVSGKNEDAAISAALEQLGMDRDDVAVEIVKRAKSGFLGIGSTLAVVKVTYEAPDEEPAKEEPEPVPAPKAAPAEKAEEPNPRPAARTAPAPEPSKPEPSKPEPAERPAAGGKKPENGTVEQRITEFLSGLLERMEVNAEINISQKEDGSYLVILQGEKLGGIIGRRGETMDAIQQLTNYAINHNRSKRVRIHLDAENYRAKREQSLERLAVKVAGKVVKYRRNITLEPMNAYERHVIHAALQDYDDIITYSTGVEPNRRTVVAYSKGKHSY